MKVVLEDGIAYLRALDWIGFRLDWIGLGVGPDAALVFRLCRVDVVHPSKW